MGDKQLIVIVGPTGVGKSEYALRIAREYQVPIISADSRQIYRQMPIGTDAPTSEVMSEVPHFFVGTKDITDSYSAYDYAREARIVITEQLATHDTALLVGGSMMYISAVLYGMDDVPIVPTHIRQALWHTYETSGIAPLLDEISLVDPLYLGRIDPHNHKRIIRALEVYRTTGRPYSSYHTGRRQSLPYPIRIIGIERPREILYERINRRVHAMVERGLIDEVRALLPHRDLNALNTIGYKEVFTYLDGQITLEECLSQIAKHTRTYARQQLSYFKKLEGVSWLKAE